MSKTIEFTVKTQPVPMARPRFSLSGHCYMAKASSDYQRLLVEQASAAAKETGWQLDGEGPFSVTIVVMRRGKRGDIDNYSKAALDGITRARLWRDDRYVSDLRVTVHSGCTEPSLYVKIQVVA